MPSPGTERAVVVVGCDLPRSGAQSCPVQHWVLSSTVLALFQSLALPCFVPLLLPCDM